MKTKITALLLSVLALGFSTSASAATCTGVSSWGSLGPPGSRNFGADFGSTGNYLNCYTFSLSANADAFGGAVAEDDWLNRLNISVNSVSLFNGGVSGNQTGSLFASDSSASSFSFGALNIGTYTLAISSTVSRAILGFYNSDVGFDGSITTSRRATPVNVAEPGALALMGMALAALGFALRRRLALSK
jgi:hypothetical protein